MPEQVPEIILLLKSQDRETEKTAMVLIFCDKEIYTHKGFFASHGHGFSREEPAFPCIIREAPRTFVVMGMAHRLI